ncbi:substrate-binding periplasmic protein [Paludibacterium paludis]|uniref:ABC transporter substrate-binding protein n=2 Tax=Paludibacterium paludis TaxID=1225769 RepID=A0A918U8P7_9NEIS|nr:transporter substrate-binding domain-containing protein [Paludibacterium paludis]GGY09876.1 ABC transporter substrate-binding protein [Paludibacterium paludis]
MLCALLAANVGQAEEILISTGEFSPWTGEKLPFGGFVNRVVREALRRQGMIVRFKYSPWARAKEELRDGTVEASSFWADDPERAGDFLLSDPLTEHRELLFHRKDTVLPKWRRLEDLSRFRFGATRSYTYTKAFWSLGRRKILKIEVSADDESSMRKMLAGRIDIFPMDEFAGWNLLASNAFAPGSRDLVTAESRPFSVIYGHLMVRRDARGARLIKRFNAGLQSMKADGTLAIFKEDLYRGSATSR